MLKRIALTFTLLTAVAAFARAEAPPTHAAEHGSATAVDTGHGAAAAEEEGGGLISLDLRTAIWTLIIFGLLLIILYPTAWKGVLAGLKARENRIRKDISDAEAARAKAEGTLREYTAQLQAAEGKIREMMAAAQAEGERLAGTIRVHAQQEAEEIKERATREIDSARKQAVVDFQTQAADVATSIAEKILRRNLNPDDQRDLVKSSLDQLQNINRG